MDRGFPPSCHSHGFSQGGADLTFDLDPLRRVVRSQKAGPELVLQAWTGDRRSVSKKATTVKLSAGFIIAPSAKYLQRRPNALDQV